MNVERYLSLDRHARRRVRLLPRPYKPRNRRTWTSSELHQYAKANGLNSAYRVRQHRMTNPDAPSTHVFAKVVGGGSWSAARVSIFGGLPASMKPHFDAKLIVQLILHGDLWTREKWCDAHRRDPQVIPSINVIRREFGANAWSNALHCAQSMSNERQLKIWLNESRKLGRPLTTLEMREKNLRFDRLADIFGGRDTLLKYLRRMFEKEIVSAPTE